jgi:hypothetical protein
MRLRACSPSGRTVHGAPAGPGDTFIRTPITHDMSPLSGVRTSRVILQDDAVRHRPVADADALHALRTTYSYVGVAASTGILLDRVLIRAGVTD